MKKIGILTFHKSINYGSVLQTWSTQYVLRKKGYDVEIIDYEPKRYEELYDAWRKSKNWNSLKTNIKRFPFYKATKRQIDLFSKFRKNKLNMSSENYTYIDDFSSIGRKYDIVICGSDQIWNLHAPDCDPIYFLPIEHMCKKIAYAVSINDTDFTEDTYKDNLKSWILDFDYISNREKSGAEKISRFLKDEKKIHVTLDPTLLNSKEDFEQITNQRFISGKYIFMYFASYSKSLVDAIKEIQKKTKLPVYSAFMTKDGKDILQMYKDGIKINFRHTAPGDFLSLIKYSELVVTNSFHGTAFSLIFEKRFVCINEVNRFGNKKNDERIENILNYLELKDRYIIPKEVEEFDFTKALDYYNITQKRMKLAQQSIDWLIDGIEDNNENRTV